MTIPTKKEITILWDEYHVPENIRKHSEQVAKVAVFLAKKLNENGINVNSGLVEAAALLHDLARAANFERFDLQPGATKEDIAFWKQLNEKYGTADHAETAAKFVEAKFPEVAKAMRAHGVKASSGDTSNWGWEEKLLCYSDRRVVHDRIVSLSERFEDGGKRHGMFFEKLHKKTGINYKKLGEENSKKIENEIFGIININPEELNNLK